MLRKSICAAIIAAGMIQPVCAADNVPQAPVNAGVPSAAATYSSISLLWGKPENYSDITGYKVYIN